MLINFGALFKVLFLQLWPLWVIVLVIVIIQAWSDSEYIPFRYFRRLQKEKMHTPTPEAKRLGELLKTYGWKVEFEKWDGYKHIDIAITEAKVDIEIDGKQHNLNPNQALADLKRTYYSFKKGYVTLRIPNVLVRDTKTIEETGEFINQFLKTSDQQLENY